MKKYIFILVSITLCYSQSTGLSIYGAGENIQNSDPASLSMGNSFFFSGNSKNISTGSPSSLWRSTLTQFTIHSGINVLESTQYPKQFHQILTSFSLHFPVGEKKVFGFGLQPIFRTNKLNIQDEYFQFIGADENSFGAPIAFKNNYSINGGISELFLEYSQKVSSHFSGGIKYSFLFGNQYIDDELYIYDISIDSLDTGLIIAEIISGADTIYAKAEDGIMTGLSKYRQFLGSILTMEGRYTDEKQEFLFRASVNGSIRVKTKNIQFSNNTTYTNSFINTSDPILSEVGIGYLYKIKNNSAIIMELYKKYPLNIPENASLFNVLPPEENSIHLGSFYQIRNTRVGLWNSINIRGGAYLKELDFTGDKFLDYGATIGIGLEYFSNSQSIDFAFRAGKKESRIANGEYEKYISFHFGFTTGEKWFMKSRRK